jgi:hypothetical protein
MNPFRSGRMRRECHGLGTGRGRLSARLSVRRPRQYSITTCDPLETIARKPGLGPISCYIGSMDETKLAELLELALRELYVINTPDLGLEVGGQKRAARALAKAIAAVVTGPTSLTNC